MPERTLNLSLRPRNFDEMIGNEEAVSAAKNMLDSGKVPVAWMFVGPFGTGKTTLARIIARELQGFDFPADIDPEVQEINAADVTGVDAMRSLAQQAAYRPLVGKYKIIILDEAHRLSAQAQDVLLKEWEKVDTSTVWIVCTTESKKIVKGLHDRAFKIPLAPMTPGDREKLVARAAATMTSPPAPEVIKEFLAEASKAGINSPRDILMSFERLSVGIPAKDAVIVEKTDPKYFEIVKAACYGSWPECAKLLMELNDQLSKDKKSEGDKDATDDDADDKGENKASAAQAIRGIAGGFLRSMLLGGSDPKKAKAPASGARAKAIYDSIIALRNSAPQINDPAMAFPAICAALWAISANLHSNK